MRSERGRAAKASGRASWQGLSVLLQHKRGNRRRRLEYCRHECRNREALMTAARAVRLTLLGRPVWYQCSAHFARGFTSFGIVTVEYCGYFPWSWQSLPGPERELSVKRDASRGSRHFRVFSGGRGFNPLWRCRQCQARQAAVAVAEKRVLRPRRQGFARELGLARRRPGVGMGSAGAPAARARGMHARARVVGTWVATTTCTSPPLA